MAVMQGAHAAEAQGRLVAIDGKDFSQRLVSEVGFVEDVEASWTIQDVLQLPDSAYQYTAHDTLQFGYSKSAYWLRVQIRNELNHLADLTLQVRYPLLDFVDFYHLDPDGVVDHQMAGDHRNLQEREYPVKDYLYRLQLDPGQVQAVFIRVQSTSSLSLPVYVSTDTPAKPVLRFKIKAEVIK